MAHELEFQDGVASMFSVRQTPWHQFGHVISEAPTFDEAIRLAKLDYTVVKRPTKIVIEIPGGDTYLKDSAKSFATIRTDTNQELGSVGPDYEPVQNLDAFRIIEPLLDKGVMTLETGGVLRDGADAWLQGKWDLEKFGPITREVFSNEVVPYALLACNHAGRRGVLVKKTNVRVVCANTLGFAESDDGESITIRHSGDALQRLIEAAEGLFLNFVEEYEVLSLQYKAMKETFLSEADFKALVLDVVAPDPRENQKFNPEARMADAVVERYENKKKTLVRLWEAGSGHVADHSAWEAYNGAVEALDHDVDGLWPNRSGVYRTQSLLDGTLATMKKQVLNNLVEYAQQVE